MECRKNLRVDDGTGKRLVAKSLASIALVESLGVRSGEQLGRSLTEEGNLILDTYIEIEKILQEQAEKLLAKSLA